MSDLIVKWDAHHARFFEREVTAGRWRVEIIPKEITSTLRDMRVFRARRTGNLIKHQWHGDQNTFCPPMWYDLAIGSGACGYLCRLCFLMLTFREMRDPRSPVLYDNIEDFDRKVKHWLANPFRRPQHTLGLGIDCSDSLIYEGVTGHARRYIPLFADSAANPSGCKLVLLTKSANVDYLKGLPTQNTVVTFSLNPEHMADLWEGKYEDGMRVTPSISARLAAARRVQEWGFEIRFRIDPILPVPGWEQHYDEFFHQAAADGLLPSYITLGTYRGKGPTLDLWRERWGLPPTEFDVRADLTREGTHSHIPAAERQKIYRIVNSSINRAWPSLQDSRGVRLSPPFVELCKETHDVRRAVGFASTAHCNCLR